MGRCFSALSLLTAIAAGVLTACNSPGDVYNLAEWRDVLKGNGNWHMVQVPDSKLAPGSIVKITEQDGLRWIDSLDSCGVPRDLLVPKPVDAEEPTLIVLGASPSIQFKKKAEFNAEVMLNISGITAGPEFKNVHKVTLAIGENGGDAIRLLQLRQWILDNADKFKQVCLDELGKPDRYLVAESFRFSSATYALFDETGGKIELTLPQIGRILELDPSVGYTVTTEGNLQIGQPMYVAVRRAISTTGGFETLSEEPTETRGDAKLNEFNADLQ